MGVMVREKSNSKHEMGSVVGIILIVTNVIVPQ